MRNDIYALLTNYDKIDEDIRTELPLKKIWTITELDTDV